LDRDSIYQKPLHEQDLAGLAELCANVAINHSADSTQTDTAHALRLEWIRLRLDHATDGKNEALRKRMLDFLSELPAWMMSGL
jgi:hypothetical protein